MSHLKNMKIRLTEQHNFDVVSRALADAGYENVVGQTVFDDATELYVYSSGSVLKTTKESGSGDYFKRHVNEEYFLTPAGFVPKDYFKQPETKLNILERFENPVTDEDIAVEGAFDAIIEGMCKPTQLPSKAEHERLRKVAILKAMLHNLENKKDVPTEWHEELNELLWQEVNRKQFIKDV
jgi:hypothetical protein